MAEKGRQNKKRTNRTKIEKTMTSTPAASIAPAVHDLIGHKLRAYYEEVTKEPVPDRFTSLLAELESRTVSKKST